MLTIKQQQEIIWRYYFTESDLDYIAKTLAIPFTTALDVLRPYFEEAYVKRNLRT